MVNYIHKLSAILFYALGVSFFVAYLIGYKEISPYGYWWLRIADLPLACAAMIYGGTSLYLSIRPSGKPSKALGWSIGVILLCAFVFIGVLNFWRVF